MTARQFIAALSRIGRMRFPETTPVRVLKARTEGDPFRILVGTVLSARTRDQVTAQAVDRLFARASTPEALRDLDVKTLERLIYPVGFFHTKALHLRELVGRIVEDHGGRVPATLEALLALPGVGRKTAALVLSRAFGVPAICVDVHVHRICNRLGVVRTRTPEQTERELMRLLPRRHWSGINEELVAFGQTLCLPGVPRCPVCPILNCPSRRA